MSEWEELISNTNSQCKIFLSCISYYCVLVLFTSCVALMQQKYWSFLQVNPLNSYKILYKEIMYDLSLKFDPFLITEFFIHMYPLVFNSSYCDFSPTERLPHPLSYSSNWIFLFIKMFTLLKSDCKWYWESKQFKIIQSVPKKIPFSSFSSFWAWEGCF